MTPTEKLLAEQEKIVAERGYYIRPVRMANLMKAASRIFDKESREKLYAKCKAKGLQLIATRVTDSNVMEVTNLDDDER